MECEIAIAVTTLACALIWDQLLGEYPAPLHPVVWIGKIVSLFLKAAPQQGWWRQAVFGTILAVSLLAMVAFTALAALRAVADLPWLEILVGTYLLKGSFALRELGAAGRRVRTAVEAGDLPGAREGLRSLCSRDPTHLDDEALLSATIQSLAENASDSFVAPLFYFAIFGVPGALAYRAINTLDAMIGYRGPFEALGKAAARLDDAANWVPARLTAALLLAAGWLTRCDATRGWHIMRRDGAHTPSPNGGRPMAMLAGLLGVQLEKKGVYSLGNPDHAVMPTTVRQAWRLVLLTAWMAAGLCALAVAGVDIMRSMAVRA
jgi:adenosylcobinamide-phosphate synthase